MALFGKTKKNPRARVPNQSGKNKPGEGKDRTEKASEMDNLREKRGGGNPRYSKIKRRAGAGLSIGRFNKTGQDLLNLTRCTSYRRGSGKLRIPQGGSELVGGELNAR